MEEVAIILILQGSKLRPRVWGRDRMQSLIQKDVLSTPSPREDHGLGFIEGVHLPPPTHFGSLPALGAPGGSVGEEDEGRLLSAC